MSKEVIQTYMHKITPPNFEHQNKNPIKIQNKMFKF